VYDTAACQDGDVRAPTILRTPRLVLAPRDPADAVVYRALWAERDARVPAHRRIDPDGRPSVEDIARGIAEEAAPMWGVRVSETAALVGYCGLVVGGGGSPNEPELAFELLRDAQGKGYATEAAGAVVAWADAAGHPRLWATVWEWNTASRRVLHKVGFRETGEVSAESEHGRSLVTAREPALP
jgi:ribosomal-protein-alanine N-acetyltransferase